MRAKKRRKSQRAYKKQEEEEERGTRVVPLLSRDQSTVGGETHQIDGKEVDGRRSAVGGRREREREARGRNRDSRERIGVRERRLQNVENGMNEGFSEID